MFEGEKTEPLYFSALNSMKDFVGISSLTELINIERLPGEENWSNPQKILELLEIDLSGKITYNKLFNAMIDTLYMDSYLKKNNELIKEFSELLSKFIKNTLHKNGNDIVDDLQETIGLTLGYFKEKWPDICGIIMENIESSLGEMEIVYDSEIDTICLVVDRDPQSFKSFQFDNVMEICKRHHYNFLITNPCFEFWLLLHFDAVNVIDKTKMQKNNKVTSKCRFLEKELKKLLDGYHKNDYDAKKLVKNIQTAIKNEKNFCETLPELKTQLGSNIGAFLESIIK